MPEADINAARALVSLGPRGGQALDVERRARLEAEKRAAEAEVQLRTNLLTQQSAKQLHQISASLSPSPTRPRGQTALQEAKAARAQRQAMQHSKIAGSGSPSAQNQSQVIYATGFARATHEGDNRHEELQSFLRTIEASKQFKVHTVRGSQELRYWMKDHSSQKIDALMLGHNHLQAEREILASLIQEWSPSPVRVVQLNSANAVAALNALFSAFEMEFPPPDRDSPSGSPQMSEVDALRAENDRLRAENAALKAENAALKAENGALKAENGALKAENAAVKAENGALKAKNAKLEAELDGERLAKEAAQQEATEAKAEASAAKAEAAEAKQEAEAAKQEAEVAKQAAAAAEQKAEAAVQEAAAAKEETAAAKRETEAAKAEAEEAKAQVAEQTAAREAAETEAKAAKEQAAVLQETLNQLNPLLHEIVASFNSLDPSIQTQTGDFSGLIEKLEKMI